MISVTEYKPQEEVLEFLEKCQSVYIIGCGSCTTITHTGGKAEVLKMKESLAETGKEITGWMVIPTACDELAKDALKEAGDEIQSADCLLIMTCAFGVQNIAMFTGKPVFPALNTIFIGKEQTTPGLFSEVCRQCGDCVLAWTGGICPVVSCSKGLLNGPCGGTDEGKCEVDSDKDCAWTMIYNRLKDQGRLDLFDKEQPPKHYQSGTRPGKITIQ
ncbi:MAG: methylenetetrahydrofolate reductase C-terminal domain-containing protein [Dehalococcoidales bacterium]|jgi:ferredoxin|nr:5,10-methylenetetrahydrofolate reductase [Dehalococcoidales bacterium]MDP6501540.1 methylenetetrahydrofolate reductase C-terminal domain-containing protein [Dehalococcoidales bacterium]MDP6632097.1 methylenetetrahydrofolate reductase C-terminal domain-containing protein [Dehalococcoidales bacterium]